MRTRISILFAFLALGLAGCTTDYHLDFLGYTTRPNYDPGIQRIFVPIFQNDTYRRQIEFDLTRAVIREIEAKSPYKITNHRDEADAELLGRIVSRKKTLINSNQLNETREAEILLGVELQFFDLRPGHLGDPLLLPDNQKPGDLTKELPPDLKKEQLLERRKLQKVLVQPVGTFIPELGGSMTSAEQQVINRLAVQIVSMMEVWR